jgi:predicted anti-sigma-YlaC factor YlaD
MKLRFTALPTAVLPVFVLFLVFSGCSINRMATRAVADALTGVGESTVFTGDTDPELVGDALPFAIKIYEALLESEPNHQGLILTTGSLFVMYANAFVQGPAEMLPPARYLEKRDALARAKKLYLRGVVILSDGLEKRYPGISAAAPGEELDKYLAKLKKSDVPTIYWLVAGTLSAYAVSPLDLEMGMRLQKVTALINRAYELDPDFNHGALDEFFVLYYASLPVGLGGDKAKAEVFFRQALEKTGGNSPGPYVSYAQAICIPAQDYETFRDYLEKALAIDPDADPANRLVNIITQRKAQYLLDNISRLFLLPQDAWDENWEDEDWE